MMLEQIQRKSPAELGSTGPESKRVKQILKREDQKVKLFPQWVINDLAKSGISPELAYNEYGFRHVKPDFYQQFLGYCPSDKIDGYAIPYCYPESGVYMTCPNGHHFVRIKFREPISISESKKPMKYATPLHGGVRVFIPKGAHEKVIKNIRETLYITEGEKKSIKATQEGFPCFGLCGIWGWMESKVFRQNQYEINRDLIPYVKSRKVCLIYDSDAQETPEKKKNFHDCAVKFAESLNYLGARLYRVDLPELGSEGGHE